MNREELNKLFDEHFIDDCNEVHDARNEIIKYAEKAVKLFAIPDVVVSFCPDCNSEDTAITGTNTMMCLNCGTHWEI